MIKLKKHLNQRKLRLDFLKIILEKLLKHPVFVNTKSERVFLKFITQTFNPTSNHLMHHNWFFVFFKTPLLIAASKLLFYMCSSLLNIPLLISKATRKVTPNPTKTSIKIAKGHVINRNKPELGLVNKFTIISSNAFIISSHIIRIM
jgi:hypothetical protein